MRAEVAAAALEAGAALVNDVSGGLADPAMAELVADARVPLRRDALARAQRPNGGARASTTTSSPTSATSSRAASTPLVGRRASTRTRIVLDPGFGFAKRAEHNWALLAHLDELLALGQPLLVGASRKRFLGPAARRRDGARRRDRGDDA